MIFAVDFDGALSMGQWPELGPANLNLFEFLIWKRKLGHKVILWTCREGKSLEDAVDFCKDFGLRFDAVNDNLPEVIEKYGSNPRKITCDVYIDAKSCYVDEFEFLGDVNIGRIETALNRFAEKVTMVG
ncbi:MULTISPECIES: hypothetical protein [unclassified Butyrivibrio]|uniref:hypothetical protein n=1 Tax=unclassified Butyrivibrio TaxID=2639466 RepID=UPI0003B5C303|nr:MULTISPECIES: hypothetical protein [unclassified Butyrivibrio]MDC7292073.1 hypothetical protein [Butyrivibrio sp. DSM 10294]